MTSGRRPTLLKCALFISCLLLVLGAADAALAQPFGMSSRLRAIPVWRFWPLQRLHRLDVCQTGRILPHAVGSDPRRQGGRHARPGA